ncbi:MAG: mucoidy inhibitor MuiA family protein [Marinoscillum sp.]
MKTYAILLLFIFTESFSQQISEREITTTIDEVTVFIKGAQITRTGTTSIPTGKSKMIVKGLSPYMDGKSVQVKATGNFTILSVNPTLNFLNQIKREKRVDSLNQILTDIDLKIERKQARLEVLDEKSSVLNVNRKLGSDNLGVTVSQLRDAIEFYEQQYTAIKNEKITVTDEIENLNKDKQNVLSEIHKISKNKELPSGEVEIQVDADQFTKGTFKVTYLVTNAGWYPKYDIRVESVDNPLQLTYKADVYQQTGINWDNVRLKLSNGNPNESGVAPTLRTWYLNFARNTIINRNTFNRLTAIPQSVSGMVYDETGEPLIGTTVVVQGTTIGTITDINGNYSLTLPNGASNLMFSFVGYESQILPINSDQMDVQLEMDIQSLSEVVVVGYGVEGSSSYDYEQRPYNSYKEPKAKTVTTTVIENQTTVEFEVDEPYSVKSNGEKITVDLSNHEIETTYEYFAVPKLDKDAFLIARVTNWDQFNLLEGEANLYFEDAFVGRTILNASSMEDTLSISLGRDKSIIIGRNKVNDYSKRRTIGNNKIETRGFDILAKNKKSAAIKLTLFDQVPVSAISDIEVELTEKSKALHNEKTGELKWEFTLSPQEQVNLKLGYQVKYPKHEKVILE